MKIGISYSNAGPLAMPESAAALAEGAEKYGIEAPVSILVGRDGAAVAFGASGEGLGDFVAAQLDPKSDKAGDKKKKNEKEAADGAEGEPEPDPEAKAESGADERKTDGDDEAADRASEDESQDD